MDDLIVKLKKDVIDTLNLKDIEPEQLDEDEPFLNGRLGLDSIDILELVVMLKKEYGISIPDLKCAKEVLRSVSAMEKYIEDNKAL